MISKPNQRAFPVMPGPRASGLTKREYFAAMAMQGLLAAEKSPDAEDIADLAVAYADDLIESLNVLPDDVAGDPVDAGGNEGGT